MRVWLPPQQHSCRSQTTVTEIQIGRKLQIDENLLSPKQHVSNWQLTHILLTQSFKSCCRLGKATPTNKYLQQITTMWEQSSEYKKLGPERKNKIYKSYLLVDTDLEGVRTNAVHHQRQFTNLLDVKLRSGATAGLQNELVLVQHNCLQFPTLHWFW